MRTSTLLNFSTNLARNPQSYLHVRKAVPLIDAEAYVTYYLICRKEKEALLPQPLKADVESQNVNLI